MALPDRLTASQIITSLDTLGVKAPAAVTVAYQRIARIGTAAANLGPARDDLYVAITRALDEDRDPAVDPEVQRILVASQLDNDGVTRAVNAITYDQFRQVCTEHADAIIKALAQPFDTAVKTLDTAHARIGNLPLEDSDTIMRKGGDIAVVWGHAQVAVATIDTVITGWVGLGEFTRLAPLDSHHMALRLAAVSYREWVSQELRERKITPWEAVLAGLDLNLPTFDEYRERIRILAQGRQQSEQPPIDRARSAIAGREIRVGA